MILITHIIILSIKGPKTLIIAFSTAQIAHLTVRCSYNCIINDKEKPNIQIFENLDYVISSNIFHSLTNCDIL